MGILRKHEDDTYRVGDWYLGAIHALHNKNNPDRISQAAQSLRELVEKLPFVVQTTDIPVFRPDPSLLNLRNNLRSRFLKDIERYKGNWRDKTIDFQLNKTLADLGCFLELSQAPSRMDRIQSVIEQIDPMVGHLGQNIINKRRGVFKSIWLAMEKFAHHGSNKGNKEGDFLTSMQDLENLLTDMLAPVTAEDQAKIRSIISQTIHSDEDLDTILNLISRRGVNHVYFFLNAKDPFWFVPLKTKGYFNSPPGVTAHEDGRVEYTRWPELVYLRNISKAIPDEIISVVLELPEVNNPYVYDLILEIALNVDGNRSVKLMPKIVEYIELGSFFLPNRFTELLVHWNNENKTQEAILIAKALTRFYPGTRL